MKQLILLGIFSLFIVNKKLKVKDDPIKLKNKFELTFEKVQRLPFINGKYSTLETRRGNKYYIFKIELKNLSRKTNQIDFNKITIVDKERKAEFKPAFVTNTGAVQLPITKVKSIKPGKKKSVNIAFSYDENKNPKYLKFGNEIIKIPYK